MDLPAFDDATADGSPAGGAAGAGSLNAEAKALLDWHNEKGKPLAATDSEFIKKQGQLFDEQKLATSLPMPASSLRGQMASAASTGPPRRP
jgi:hypothetical protein